MSIKNVAQAFASAVGNTVKNLSGAKNSQDKSQTNDTGSIFNHRHRYGTNALKRRRSNFDRLDELNQFHSMMNYGSYDSGSGGSSERVLSGNNRPKRIQTSAEHKKQMEYATHMMIMNHGTPEQKYQEKLKYARNEVNHQIDNITKNPECSNMQKAFAYVRDYPELKSEFGDMWGAMNNYMYAWAENNFHYTDPREYFSDEAIENSKENFKEFHTSDWGYLGGGGIETAKELMDAEPAESTQEEVKEAVEEESEDNE